MKINIPNRIILTGLFLFLHFIKSYSQGNGCEPPSIPCFQQPGAPHWLNNAHSISTSYYLDHNGYTAVLYSPDIVEGIQCYWEYLDGGNWVRINGGINESPLCGFKVGRSGDYRLSYYCYTDPRDPSTLRGELHSSPMHIMLHTPPCDLNVFAQPIQKLIEADEGGISSYFIPSLLHTCDYNVDPDNTVVTICSGHFNSNSSANQNSYTCAEIRANVESPNGPFRYDWSPHTGILVGAGIEPAITVNPSTSTVYTCVVTDSQGCTASTTITVNPLGLASEVHITSTQYEYFCEGDLIHLCADGAERYSFPSWNRYTHTTDNCYCFNANPVDDCPAPGSTPPSFTYTVVGWDENGCATEDKYHYQVLSTPNISISASNYQICAGNTTPIHLHATEYTNCSYQYEWNWWPSNSQSGHDIDVTPPSTNTDYVVRVFNTYNDPGGNSKTCTATQYLTVNVFTPPALSISSIPSSICQGTTLTVTAQGGASYTWSSNPIDPTMQTHGNYITITPSYNSLQYVYTVSSVNGPCIGSISTTALTVNPIPIISNLNDTHICPHSSITLEAQGANSFSWTNGPQTASYTVTPLTTTTYTVVGENQFHCTTTQQITVYVYHENFVSVIADEKKFCLNSHDHISMQASGGAPGHSYLWSPSTALNVVNLPDVVCNSDDLINQVNPVTIYTVTTTDINNCPISGSIDITYLGDCGSIINCDKCISTFSPIPDHWYIISGWVKEPNNGTKLRYENAKINLNFSYPILGPTTTISPSGDIIDGWQRIEDVFHVPQGATDFVLTLDNQGSTEVYFDDIRVFPKDGSMKSFVYDPETLRLVAELDDNNYATFYEYDEEGALVRVKKETERGIVTVKESRNSIHKKQP